MAKNLIKINQVTLQYKEPKTEHLPYVEHSQSAWKLLNGIINYNQINDKRFFYVLLLTNDRNHFKLLGTAELEYSIYLKKDFREIIQLALLSNAVGIILANNHPKQLIKAVVIEIENSNELKTLLNQFKIQLFDHLIIDSHYFYTMKGNDLL